MGVWCPEAARGVWWMVCGVRCVVGDGRKDLMTRKYPWFPPASLPDQHCLLIGSQAGLPDRLCLRIRWSGGDRCEGNNLLNPKTHHPIFTNSGPISSASVITLRISSIPLSPFVRTMRPVPLFGRRTTMVRTPGSLPVCMRTNSPFWKLV